VIFCFYQIDFEESIQSQGFVSITQAPLRKCSLALLEDISQTKGSQTKGPQSNADTATGSIVDHVCQSYYFLCLTVFQFASSLFVYYTLLIRLITLCFLVMIQIQHSTSGDKNCTLGRPKVNHTKNILSFELWIIA